ncbi:hypothetical protein OIU78_026449, partial [Salix suchowensis]
MLKTKIIKYDCRSTRKKWVQQICKKILLSCIKFTYLYADLQSQREAKGQRRDSRGQRMRRQRQEPRGGERGEGLDLERGERREARRERRG